MNVLHMLVSHHSYCTIQPSNTAKLTLILLPWRIWYAPNNASRWQMGFYSPFKGLNAIFSALKNLQMHDEVTWKL